jgi:hypothetical protein
MTSFFKKIGALAGRFRSGSAGLACDMRWSYIPPLMVYFAAGVSGFTSIIEAFFVKENLGLSVAMLTSLGFWAGLPWAMKMPLGHLVDRFWHRKALFVYLGAALMAASLLIMVGLTGHTAWMATMLPLDTWYVVAVLLAPIGYVLQDVVADAMTVEAVSARREDGTGYTETEQQQMHVTMQTLGRMAIVGGGALVAGAIPGGLSFALRHRDDAALSRHVLRTARVDRSALRFRRPHHRPDRHHGGFAPGPGGHDPDAGLDCPRRPRVTRRPPISP